MIFCFLLWIILKNPRYSGPSKLIKIESKDHFFELVGKDVSPSTGTNQQASKNHNKDFSKVKSTFLVFNANWCDQCYYTYSLWVKFANKYTTSKMQFIEIDVTQFDSLARHFKVNTGSLAG